MNSLKDQLLKAGLAPKKSKKPQPKKKKEPTKAKKHRNATSEATLRAQRAMLDKAKKDKKLNEQRQAEAAKKQLAAQIKQLVDGSKLDRKDGETAYHFTFEKKVKSIYVTLDQQKQLSRDQVVIVSLGLESFEIVPKLVAQKIAERDAKCVIQNDKPAETEAVEDDPYADYQIPDDLVW